MRWRASHKSAAVTLPAAAAPPCRPPCTAPPPLASLLGGLRDLRHRRVTTWLAEGGDVAKVREAMGHADLRTTMGYTHLVRENLRSLVETVGPMLLRKEVAQ
jgi:hypothetical protein